MTAALAVEGPEYGVVIGGRYRLERPLMKGGMGSVWVATHVALGHEVALKFIHVEGDARADALRRFEREAQVIARLKSPYVVQVLDYGIDEASRPYLAMELLSGESLKARLSRARSLSIEDTARIVVQVCRAIHRAHAAGVVHRDIKPGNIFLCDDDDYRVKVLDFGIAKTVGLANTDQHNTATGMIVGTPGYMSPEQALGRADLDGRSDLFSLGVVAWRCLTGHHPHEREGTPASFGELIVKVATQSVPLPSTVVTGIPVDLDLWFAKVLATKPSDRFASAKAMADALTCALGMNSIAFNTGEYAAAGADDVIGVAISSISATSTSGARLGPVSSVHVRRGEVHAGPAAPDHGTMLNTVTFGQAVAADARPTSKFRGMLTVGLPIFAISLMVLLLATSRASSPKLEGASLGPLVSGTAPASSGPPVSDVLAPSALTAPSSVRAFPDDDGGAKVAHKDVAASHRKSNAVSPPFVSAAPPRKEPSVAVPPASSATPHVGDRGRLLDDRL